MIQFENLTLRVGGNVLLQGLDITVQTGSRLGIVGANGCGKSSLLKVITGELTPDAGEFRLPGNWRLAHMAQLTPSGSLSAHDFVLDGHAPFRQAQAEQKAAEASGDGQRVAEAHAHFDAINGYRIPAMASELLHGLGFTSDEHGQSVDQFSGGWRMRLNLARALMTPSDLLLLDEPTNHLDLDTLIWLQDWLHHYKGTLIIISHDREFLDAVCNHILHIEHKTGRLYRGNYSDFEKQRAEVLAQQQAAHKQQQREVEHLHRFVERFRAKATKAKQAQSRIKALERMERIAPAHVDSPFHFHFREARSYPNPLMQLHDCTATYGERVILDHINLQLSPGDRIGLLGANGAGKSTLIKLLIGELASTTGETKTARDLAIGYFAQHQLDQLDDDASPLLHLQRLDDQNNNKRADDQSLRDYLGGFGFHGDRALENVKPFSGGEKARLSLALIIYQRPNVLLLDEPTNHLDLEMRHALSLALQEFEGALVLVSHDRALLQTVCDRFYLVHHGQVSEFDGDLQSYRKLLQERQNRNDTNKSGADHSAGARRDKRREQALRRERLRPLINKQKQLEHSITELEQKKEEIEQALSQSELYNDEARKPELQELMMKQGSIKQQLDDAESQWLDISAQLEEN